MSQVEYIKTLLENGNWTDNEKRFLENSIRDAEIMDNLPKNNLKNKIRKFFKNSIDRQYQVCYTIITENERR